MTYCPLYVGSLWTSVNSLAMWMLSTSQDHLYYPWMLSTSQDYLSYPWVIDFPIMWSTNILEFIKNICQIPIKELLRP